MNHLCPVCKQSFRPEPGFYFGSAVVSYPLMVVFSLIVAAVFYLIVGDLFDHVAAFLLALVIASLIILPAVFRYSRILWLYIVFRYRGPGGNSLK